MTRLRLALKRNRRDWYISRMKTRYIYFGAIAAGVVLAIVGFATGNALRIWGILIAVVAAIALIVHVQNEKKVAERLAREKDMFRRDADGSQAPGSGGRSTSSQQNAGGSGSSESSESPDEEDKQS